MHYSFLKRRKRKRKRKERRAGWKVEGGTGEKESKGRNVWSKIAIRGGRRDPWLIQRKKGKGERREEKKKKSRKKGGKGRGKARV